MWLAVEPLDMRSGTEAALARVVRVFGAAHPHHAYLFAEKDGKTNRASEGFRQARLNSSLLPMKAGPTRSCRSWSDDADR